MFDRVKAPRVVHLKCRRAKESVVLTWDVRGAKALRWRVLRSPSAPAVGPFDDAVAGSGQSLVSDQVTPGSHDDQTDPRSARHYAIFAEDEAGQWHRVAVTRIAGSGGRRQADDDFESSPASPGWLDAGWATRAGSGDHPR